MAGNHKKTHVKKAASGSVGRPTKAGSPRNRTNPPSLDGAELPPGSARAVKSDSKDKSQGIDPSGTAPSTGVVRIQKFLADSGVCSRRAGEALVTDGRVSVNGVVIRMPGTPVHSVSDSVAVDGVVIRPKRKRYLAIYKPIGVVCTRADELGRPIVSDFLPTEWSDVYPVGRLDRDSEGLLLMTNDGEFCLRVTHPRYKVVKKYRVTVRGKVENRDLRPAMQGLHVGDEVLRISSASVLAKDYAGSLIEMDLVEGKNREIRRIMEFLGHKVENLRRIQIGAVKLGSLKPGKWRVLQESEVAALLR